MFRKAALIFVYSPSPAHAPHQPVDEWKGKRLHIPFISPRSPGRRGRHWKHPTEGRIQPSSSCFQLAILVKMGLLELVSNGDELVVPTLATVWSPVPRTVPASFIPPRNNGMTPSHQVINFYLKPHKKNKISEFPCTILTINKKPAGYTLGYI